MVSAGNGERREWGRESLSLGSKWLATPALYGGTNSLVNRNSDFEHLPESRTIPSRIRMRSWLYSKWFFAFLALVCFLDLIADLAERKWNWNTLNNIAIGLDILACVLTGWMFLDLHRKRPKGGANPRS